MGKKFNRVTFEEVSNNFSHYEVAFLSFCRASDIILSGASLLSSTSYKPKVAMVAFNDICSDVQKTKEYKESLIQKFNCRYDDAVDDEEYDVESRAGGGD